MEPTQLLIRPARTQDVPAIRDHVEPLAQRRVLLQKEAVAYYESIQEFVVAEAPDGAIWMVADASPGGLYRATPK